MPTYEYSCEKCGPFEIWQSIKDNALAACPTCGSKIQRLISANVGFVLKGSGFYQNDYKNHSSGSSNPSGQAPSKPESKPSTDAGPAHSSGPSGPSGQGCNTCGGPNPCSSGNN